RRNGPAAADAAEPRRPAALSATRAATLRRPRATPASGPTAASESPAASAASTPPATAASATPPATATSAAPPAAAATASSATAAEFRRWRQRWRSAPLVHHRWSAAAEFQQRLRQSGRRPLRHAPSEEAPPWSSPPRYAEQSAYGRRRGRWQRSTGQFAVR